MWWTGAEAGEKCGWSSPTPAVGLGKGGTVNLYIDGTPVGEGRVEATQPVIFSADETTDIGADSATPVSDDYSTQNSTFTDRVRWVQIDLGEDAEDADPSSSPQKSAAASQSPCNRAPGTVRPSASQAFGETSLTTRRSGPKPGPGQWLYRAHGGGISPLAYCPPRERRFVSILPGRSGAR